MGEKPKFDARLREGVAYFEQMLKVMPDDRTTLEFLAVAYPQMGELDKAVGAVASLARVLLKEGDIESATALLGKVKPAYESDPLVLTQIAAVTQWVMTDDPCFLCFWKPSPSAGRKVWTEALVRKIAESKDDYIRTFCRQQLDLCK